MDFGLQTWFLRHILGSVKSRGSTHGFDHFCSDFDFSSLRPRGLDIGWNEMGCLHYGNPETLKKEKL